jgi:hypothetical protein
MVRARPGRSSGLGVSHSQPDLYGVFVWVRGALNRRKRRFPARAEGEDGADGDELATATAGPHARRPPATGRSASKGLSVFNFFRNARIEL